MMTTLLSRPPLDTSPLSTIAQRKENMPLHTSSMIAENLRHYMKQAQTNPRSLAQKAQLKPSFIYDILNGKSLNPSSVKLAQVSECLDISLAQLLQPLSKRAAQPTIKQATLTPTAHIALPLLTIASGADGTRIVTQEPSETDIATPYNISRDWLHSQGIQHTASLARLIVASDNMEPTLPKGSDIIIDQSQRMPNQAGIFILFDGSKLHIKRIEATIESSDHPKYTLYNDNPRYSLSQHYLSEIEIIGRVLWVFKAL